MQLLYHSRGQVSAGSTTHPSKHKLLTTHSPNDCHRHTPKLATFASRSTAPRKGPLQPARSTTTRGVYLLRGQPYGIIPYDHTWPLVYPALRTLSDVHVSTLPFMNRGSYYHCTDWTPGSLPGRDNPNVEPPQAGGFSQPGQPTSWESLAPIGKHAKVLGRQDARVSTDTSQQPSTSAGSTATSQQQPVTIHIREVYHPRGLLPHEIQLEIGHGNDS